LLAKLCRFASASKENVFQPRLIVFTYEYPTKIHYRQIREVFQKVPIASSYGTTETGYVFMQCEKGKFHQNTEFCRVDFQPLKPEHGGPFLGRILVTTFNNPWYYLLRFNVGDLVRLDDKGKCACGRNTGFIISAIEGRIANSTLTRNGRLVTARELDENLSQLDNLDEYKLLQTSRGSYDLYLVSKQEYREELQQKASDMLTRLYGRRSRIHVLFKKKIAPESSGKYRISGTTFQLNIEDYLDYNCITESKQS
jgi:phenylacetate-coenzyme A ligase PaaK-like adenylate-forming protein